MARLKMLRKEVHDEGKENLNPLQNGDIVAVQNVTGSQPLRWSRTGVIIERINNRQYYVKMDGRRIVLLLNRKHIKLTTPFKTDKIALKKFLEPSTPPPQRLAPTSPIREDRDIRVQASTPVVTPVRMTTTGTTETSRNTSLRRNIEIIPNPTPIFSYGQEPATATPSPQTPTPGHQQPVPRRTLNLPTPVRAPTPVAEEMGRGRRQKKIKFYTDHVTGEEFD